MDLKNKKVLVSGIGRSGVSAAKLLIKVGANVTLQDNKEKDKLDYNLKELEDMGISLIVGKNPDEEIENFDILVVSPGLPLRLDFVKKAYSLNIPVIGEVELASFFIKGKIIGITGTNGKTTTTALVGEIMKTTYEKTHIVGNIGLPISDYVLESDEKDVFVVELSSYMLESVDSFHTDVATVLNLSEDHIERHGDYKSYIEAKKRIFNNQTEKNFAILNYDDEVTKNMKVDTKGKIIYFSAEEQGENFVYLKDEIIYVNVDGKVIELVNTNDLIILGIHNIYNVMSAIGIAIAMNITVENIRKAIKNFKGVEHRIEYVRTINEIEYYNDSKGTNVDATLKAINAMKKPIVLIVGGYDKKVSLQPLVESFAGKVSLGIYLGDTQDKLVEISKEKKFDNYICVNSYEEAVQVAYKKSKKGEVVLLSPACASFDMFKNFEHRGEFFKELVNKL